MTTNPALQTSTEPFDNDPVDEALIAVKESTVEFVDSRDKHYQSIRTAREKGATLRQIADAADMTHAGIAKIVKRKA